MHDDYPGNIRELRNTLERASLLTDNHTILLQHLDIHAEQNLVTAPQSFFGQNIQPLDVMEQHYLQWVLTRSDGDRKILAKQLGASERTLYRKLR